MEVLVSHALQHLSQQSQPLSQSLLTLQVGILFVINNHTNELFEITTWLENLNLIIWEHILI